jgi:ferredoxin
MFELKISDACTRCGLCVTDCPAGIIDLPDGGKPVGTENAADACINCQHCLAICPVGAVGINGVDPDGSDTFTGADLPTAERMDLLLRARRSMRRYMDKPVDSALITQMLETVAHGPTGCNHQGLTFHVIRDADRMKTFIEESMTGLVDLANAGDIPETLEMFKGIAEMWSETGKDKIFRGAPHLLVISAAEGSPCAQEDVTLAIAYFELLAQTHGIGTTWCGLAKVLLELVPASKRAMQIPENAPYYYVMLFGHPAIQYTRTTQRKTAAPIIEID